MAPITKDKIADILESIAQMLEIKGENVFKIRAYTNAARALETYTGDIVTAAGEGRLGEIPGVGKAIAEKITELVATGQLAYFEILKAEFPPGVFEMFDLQGLGPKKIKALWDKLGITTIPDLEAASKDGRVAGLSGFGKKTADNILAAIQSRAKHAGRFSSAPSPPTRSGWSASCASCRMFSRRPSRAATGGARKWWAISTSSWPPIRRQTCRIFL